MGKKREAVAREIRDAELVLLGLAPPTWTEDGEENVRRGGLDEALVDLGDLPDKYDRRLRLTIKRNDNGWFGIAVQEQWHDYRNPASKWVSNGGLRRYTTHAGNHAGARAKALEMAAACLARLRREGRA